MKPIDDLLIAEAPQALAIEVTSKCNLTCKMCPLTTGSTLSSATPDDMTTVLWQDILPLAKRYRNVMLTGYGEPLLNPNFLPMLRELNQAQVNFSVTTNGTPITKSVALELASLESMNQLTVSIDSPERDSYRSIRGGDVEKALKGVKNLMATIKDPDKVPCQWFS